MAYHANDKFSRNRKYAYGAKDKIEQLPIPQITESNKPLCDEIIKCVDKILESKAKDSTLDTSKLESQLTL